MEPVGELKIDIVGHFGSLFSYATVAAEVCRGLSDRDLLGQVTNLDAAWHPQHEHLIGRAERGSHAIVFSEPRHYYEALGQQYGSMKRVAFFASPNTTEMKKEHAEVMAKGGAVFAPSRWCASSVRRTFDRDQLAAPPIFVAPLGVSSLFLSDDELNAARCYRRHKIERLNGDFSPIRFLHMATDHAWPGRKGTEELIQAWAKLMVKSARHVTPLGYAATLTIHVPRGVYALVQAEVSRLALHDSVDIEFSDELGTTDEDLAALYRRHDVLICAPRCEGFGMMILAGLLNGMPTLTTYATGQEDFLSSLGGWTAVPVSQAMDVIAFEHGSAPMVRADHVADALVQLVNSHWYLSDQAIKNREIAAPHLWDSARSVWADQIESWAQEEF